MKGRLYRFTPAGGEPEHFTHDFRSVLAKSDIGSYHLEQLPVGAARTDSQGTWERIA